jgi:hypothetical protein
MDIGSLMIAHVNKVLEDVAPGPIIVQEEISKKKLQ